MFLFKSGYNTTIQTFGTTKSALFEMSDSPKQGALPSESFLQCTAVDGSQGSSPSPSRKRDLSSIDQSQAPRLGTQRVRMSPSTMTPSSSPPTDPSSPSSSPPLEQDAGGDEYIADENWMDVLFSIAENDVQQVDSSTNKCHMQNGHTDENINTTDQIMIPVTESIREDLLHIHRHLVLNDVDVQPSSYSSRKCANGRSKTSASSPTNWDQPSRSTVPLSYLHYASTQPLYQSLSSTSSVPVAYHNMRPPSEGDLSTITAAESLAAEQEGAAPHEIWVNRTKQAHLPSYEGMISTQSIGHHRPAGNDRDSIEYSFRALRSSKEPT